MTALSILDQAELAAGVRMHLEADIIGCPERVHELLSELVEVTTADEVIVLSNTHDPARRGEIYEILAEVFDLGAAVTPATSLGRASREPYDASLSAGPGGYGDG